MAYEKNKHLANIKKWKLDLSLLYESIYYGDINAPIDIKEFKGFKELCGFEIKEVKGSLNFRNCTSLTSVSNFPEKIKGLLVLTDCISLKNISGLPKLVIHDFIFSGTPLFLKFTEQQIRERYRIEPLDENIRKWKIDFDILSDGVYEGNIYIPKDITEFRGFKEPLGIEIKEIRRDLSFHRCTSLTSISNLPDFIGRSLDFDKCTSLTSISNLPKLLGGSLYFNECESLTSVSNLPEKIGRCLSFYKCTSLASLPILPENIKGLSFGYCTSLTSISKMPSVVKGFIYTGGCPFFENLTEDQIRKKYGIRKE